jgi:hypothetical protein
MLCISSSWLIFLVVFAKSGELCKVTEKSSLGLSMQTVTGGISETFQMGNGRIVSNCGWIISGNCCQRRKLFIP